jgi:hypothetical protein
MLGSQGQQLGGWFDWLDPVMGYYERAKAKLYGALGNLLGLREEILRLQDEANTLSRRAERMGNPVIIELARRIREQTAELYRAQIDTENKVAAARDKITAIDRDDGVGALPVAALAVAAAAAVAAVSAVVIHTQKVGLVKRALADLKAKLITSAEYMAAVDADKGTDPFGLGAVGDIAKWAAIGAAVYFGAKMLAGRRRA